MTIDARKKLADQICRVLIRSNEPLCAHSIGDRLRGEGHIVTKQEINSILYSGVHGKNFRSCRGESKRPLWESVAKTGRAKNPEPVPRDEPKTRKIESADNERIDLLSSTRTPPARGGPKKDDLPVVPEEIGVAPGLNGILFPELTMTTPRVKRSIVVGRKEVTILGHPALSPTLTTPPRAKPVGNTSKGAESVVNTVRYEAGEVLDDRYEVIALLGEGGMGQVLCALDLQRSRQVALKTLRRREGVDRIALKNEVELLTLIDRPDYFPRVYESFEFEGAFFMPMDLLEGEDLRVHLESADPAAIDAAFVRQVFDQICDRLDYLHNFLGGQVLFRDLKPSNIMVEKNPLTVRLIDFGIASMSERDDIHAGTRFFWAPEAQLGTYSVQSDLYALGGILSCLLQSRGASDPKKVLHTIPFSAERSLPSSLVEVVATLRSEAPGDRPASVRSAQDLFHAAFSKIENSEHAVVNRCERCDAPQGRDYFLCWKCGTWLKGVASVGAARIDGFKANLRHQLQIACDGAPDGAPAEIIDLAERAASLQRLPAYEELTCLPYIDVSPYPYQTGAALKVLRDFGGRGILADEVGLGKTIETGLIVKEYIVRKEAKRILVLVPPQTKMQWAEEMRMKFRINNVQVFGTGDGETSDRRSFHRNEVFVVVSHSIASRRDNFEMFRQSPWDVVIVDEAHRARPGRKANNLGRLVASLKTRRMLLLSATPARNSLTELYDLVSLLRPGLFAEDTNAFISFFGGRKGNWAVKNLDMLQSTLEEVMIRNRREMVHKAFPSRKSQTFRITLSAKESKAYKGFIGALQGSVSGGLVITTRARQFCSSFQALLDSSVGSDFLDHIRSVAQSSHFKTRCLIDQIVPQLMNAGEEKVIIFSQFVASQKEICAALESAGYRTAWSGNGTVKAIKQFQHDAKTRFLVTGVGLSEGVNLQFARCMINLDLPWNPQQIEQRIGRIQRLGSKFREVLVLNLMAEETIENLVIEYIEQKLGMFETVFGFVEAILGQFKDSESVEGFVRKALQQGSAGEIDPSIARRGGERIQEARQAADSNVSANRFDSLLIGLGSDAEIGL